MITSHDLYVRAWFAAFLLTVAVEVPVVVALSRSMPVLRCATWALLGQVLTHPAVWFVFPALNLEPTPRLVASEVWALAAEALLYGLSGVSPRGVRALATSAVANGASLAVSLLLRSG